MSGNVGFELCTLHSIQEKINATLRGTKKQLIHLSLGYNYYYLKCIAYT